jgi:hypothetical protein
LKLSNSNYANYGYLNIGDASGNLYFYTTANSFNWQLTFASIE